MAEHNTAFTPMRKSVYSVEPVDAKGPDENENNIPFTCSVAQLRAKARIAKGPAGTLRFSER